MPEFEFEVDPVVEAARERLERRRSDSSPMWHSLTPRLIVLVSILGSLASMLAFFLLFDFDEGAFDPNPDVLSDLEFLRWQVVSVSYTVSVVALWLGAVWWAFAAAKNARRTSPVGPSPMTPVFLYVVFPVGAWLGMYYSSSRTVDLSLFYGYIALFILGYPIVNLSFRNAARKIGAPAGPWSAVVGLPFMVFGVNFALTLGIDLDLFSGTTGTTVVMLVLVGYALALAGYIVSVGRAMATFDRACRAPRGPRDPAKDEALMNNLLAFHQRSMGVAPEDMFLPEPVS